MSAANDMIVYSLEVSRKLFDRYFGDLKPADFDHHAAPGTNSAAWVAGHLVLTDRMALAALGVTDLPPLPDGFDAQFPVTRVAAPPEQAHVTSGPELIELFHATRARLIAAAAAAPPGVLGAAAKTSAPVPVFQTVGEMVAFMGVHTALHLGQVTIIRRSLGYPPVT